MARAVRRAASRPGFEQLVCNVAQRRHADAERLGAFFRAVGMSRAGKVGLLVLPLALRLSARAVPWRHRSIRVDSGVVEHVFALRHAQEACALLEGLGAELGDLHEAGTARGEHAVLLAEGRRFLAWCRSRPATACNSEGEAVLTSTPTALTQSSTTAFRLASSRFCGISC